MVRSWFNSPKDRGEDKPEEDEVTASYWPPLQTRTSGTPPPDDAVREPAPPADQPTPDPVLTATPPPVPPVSEARTQLASETQPSAPVAANGTTGETAAATRSPKDDALAVSATDSGSAADRIAATAAEAGLPEWVPDADGVIGRTMYDLPSSEDGSVTVLLPRLHIGATPSQALVRIASADERTYLGIVVAGPFAEPDGLRADASLIVTTSVRSQPFQPEYHGRVRIELLGEEVNGVLQAPRYRPLPGARVSALDDAETALVLQVSGDIQLGRAVGHDDVPVGLPSRSKNILPRHLGIVGTTGGGKSTTVVGLLAEGQRAGLATILLDVEGEYTHVHEPTTDETMVRLLANDGRRPEGIPNTHLYRLVGRDTTNEHHPSSHEFSLRFSDLSPYTVVEILDLNEAQQERYFQAYDIAKWLAGQGRLGGPPVQAMHLDDFETGCPGVTLAIVRDLIDAHVAHLDKGEWSPNVQALVANQQEIMRRIGERKPTSPISWKAVAARLNRLARLQVFDSVRGAARPLDLDALLEPGRVNIFDLSDIDGTDLRNIVIADLLRSIQGAQERRYDHYEEHGDREDGAPRTLVIIEEAHEFLARTRVASMPILFSQVERIAKRGRKRWLGLCFVTQLPQHLAPQVSALINNWVIHKVADPAAISELRQSVSGIDDSLWRAVRGLAPGQAIVASGQMTRPVLTVIHPAAAQLRMVD